MLGLISYGVKWITRSPFADPLIVALIIGIGIRSVIGESKRLTPGFTIAPSVFIPIGVIFYAAKNLNFVEFSKVNVKLIILLIIIMLVYFGVILWLGKILKQRRQVTYLTATGSAICGASAIAITSPAVEAEPDDVSISLLAVLITAAFGLFIIFPLLAIILSLNNQVYALLSGSVLQFTGFVKAASANLPALSEAIPSEEVIPLALLVKAPRYLGLLIAIPLFASFIKRKAYVPWFLWAFLAAGLAGSGMYRLDQTLFNEIVKPIITPIYGIFWSIAMAGIGLNADIKALLSDDGAKAILMAFSGFIATIIVFLLGILIIM